MEWCQKLCLNQKKTQPTWERFSRMVCQWCVASNSGITVERPERNPYWFSDRMLLVLDCRTLNQIQTDFCLSQMVSEPTHITPVSSSILDLILVSSPSTIQSCQISAPLSNCDHNAITVGVNLLSRLNNANHLTKTIWIHAKADITHGKNLLRSLPVASDSNCVDEFWSCWFKHFLSAMRECIPSKTVPIRSFTPWIDCDISRDIRWRERWYHKFKVSKSAEWLTKYKTLRNAVVCKIRKAKQSYFNNLANSISDSKKFWSSIRLLRPRSIPSSSSLSHGSTVAHIDQDKVELLNTYFAFCFNTVSVPPTLLPTQHNLSIATLDLTHQEVQNLLLRTKQHSATGPDGISAWMLKTFAVEITPSLASLFNLSIRTGQLPAEWKSSNIVPIPKDSTPQAVQSFCPISLLPIIGRRDMGTQHLGLNT